MLFKPSLHDVIIWDGEFWKVLAVRSLFWKIVGFRKWVLYRAVLNLKQVQSANKEAFNHATEIKCGEIDSRKPNHKTFFLRPRLVAYVLIVEVSRYLNYNICPYLQVPLELFCDFTVFSFVFDILF